VPRFLISRDSCRVMYRVYRVTLDSCITQLKAQGPSRTCNENKEEEGEGESCRETALLSEHTLGLLEIKDKHPARVLP